MSNQKADGLIENLRVRRDGWTPVRQQAFLEALAEVKCVRDACALVGMSNTSAYRRRKTSPAFSAAWDRALGKDKATIEQAAYERAVIGWEEPIVYGGKVIGEKRHFSDSLLRLLIQREMKKATTQAKPRTQEALIAEAERAAKAAGGFFCTPAQQEETDRALESKLAALGRRLAREAEAARAR